MSNELMVPRSVDELSRLLADMQLVSLEDLRRCRSELGSGASGLQLLELLERRHFLTSWQISKLQKGDTSGMVLGGCKLLYKNASGSFARLYRGARIGTNESVGIKLLRDRYTGDIETVQLFRREGEIGKKLKHPNIVPIHDVGSDGDNHFIVMEFVEGGNLRDFLKIRRRLEPVEALSFALQMSRGLQYALAQGFTHRDLKSTNVLISSQKTIKLIDFGLAADDSFLNRRDSPELAVALEYSTLEKNTNAPRNDPRSDLFFLGTILYELLSGEPPYERTRSREERKQFSRYRDIRPVTSVNSAIPFRVAAVVDKLLQVTPALRYQNPGELSAELEQILSEMGSAPLSPVESAPRDTVKTLLCVEHRPRRQDMIREYFSKHGYRVLILADIDRALMRLKTANAAGVVLFGDSVGDRVTQDFQTVLDQTQGQNVVVLAVVSEEQQAQMSAQLPPRGVVMPPLTMRDLRDRLESAMDALNDKD